MQNAMTTRPRSLCVTMAGEDASGAAVGTETNQQQLDETHLVHGTPRFRQIRSFHLVVIS